MSGRGVGRRKRLLLGRTARLEWVQGTLISDARAKVTSLSRIRRILGLQETVLVTHNTGTFGIGTGLGLILSRVASDITLKTSVY